MSCERIFTELLISDQSLNFTANYALRMFTSGCYYLDANNHWRSDGLRVSALLLVIVSLMMVSEWTLD